MIYGALGVLLVLAILAAGILIGWKARKVYSERTEPVKALNEAEKKRLREEGAAFSMMMGYNADVAYGTVSAADTVRGGDT